MGTVERDFRSKTGEVSFSSDKNCEKEKLKDDYKSLTCIAA